jgi:hypothetical protein
MKPPEGWPVTTGVHRKSWEFSIQNSEVEFGICGAGSALLVR